MTEKTKTRKRKKNLGFLSRLLPFFLAVSLFPAKKAERAKSLRKVSFQVFSSPVSLALFVSGGARRFRFLRPCQLNLVSLFSSPFSVRTAAILTLPLSFFPP